MAQDKADSSQIDLRKKPEKKKDQVRAEELSPYSERWAEVVRPLTRFIFTLLGAVLLVPFLFVFVDDVAIRTIAFDWAKTILAPAVGFASAAVGYYYGTRSAAERRAESVENDPEEG